jgi:hypothetical protein
MAGPCEYSVHAHHVGIVDNKGTNMVWPPVACCFIKTNQYF